MKFLVSPTAEAVGRARPPVRVFLLFAALLLVGLVLQRASADGLWPSAVRAHYLGSGDPSERLPATALWDELHVFSFLWGFLLLMLGSLLVASSVSARLRSALTLGATAAVLGDLGAPFLVMQVPALAGLRTLAFGSTVGLLGAAVGVLFWTFGRVVPAPSR